MKNFLEEQEKADLKQRHRKEKDGRTVDRIKAVLMSDDGWSFRDIGKVLLLDEESISKHVEEYRSEKKLKIETGDSRSKLSESATQELTEHLEAHTYAKVSEVREHVRQKYEINYTVQGITRFALPANPTFHFDWV
ncbi:MAG: hypothetical protein LBI26_00585 [Holosporales bacterium]|jgi:transposase|nr:hypothetical protein [Holosporales bacterium]